MTTKIKQMQDLLKDVGVTAAPATATIKIVNAKIADEVVFPGNVSRELQVAMAMPGHGLLFGPPSTGKTTMAKAVADATGTEWRRLQLHKRFEADEWLGGTVPVDKGFEFRWSPLIEAVENGYVCILEEMFQVDPGQMGPLFTIMDDSKVFDAYCQGHVKRIHKHPDFKIIATDNSSGQGDESISGSLHGVEAQNEALLSRFSFKIHVGYLSVKDEAALLASRVGITNKNAIRMVEVADATRQEQYLMEGGQAIAFRDLQDWGRAIKAAVTVLGSTFDKAALETSTMCILNNVRVDNRESVSQFIRAKFN